MKRITLLAFGLLSVGLLALAGCRFCNQCGGFGCSDSSSTPTVVPQGGAQAPIYIQPGTQFVEPQIPQAVPQAAPQFVPQGAAPVGSGIR